MSVIAFKPAYESERRPQLLTVFCVQAYWRDQARLARGEFSQHLSMEAALRAGRRLERRAAAVLVYRIRGNVEADYWEEPVTLVRLGEERERLPR